MTSSLGTDQHTPVDTLTIPKAAVATEGHSAGSTSHDGLSASFAAAKNITAEKLGDTARTFTAQTQSGNYRGEIIGETELHVVQSLSPHVSSRAYETSARTHAQGRGQASESVTRTNLAP